MKARLKKRIQDLSDRSPKPLRIARKQDGKLNIEGLGVWHSFWRDPYHLLLTIPWLHFSLLISLTYVVLNSLFALLYLAGGDCLNGARAGSFEDAFFFSVQTLASIGYGAITPKTTYANAIVTLEALASLLAIAVMTGLAFARFTKPTARVVFSKFAVIAPVNGVPTLMFRMANQRRNQIYEAQLRLYLMRDEVTSEGQYFYRIYDLKLSRERSPNFVLSWTAMHPIDETSPLYGASPESLIEKHAQLVISFSGIDDTVSYTMNVRHSYGAREILCNHQFVDIIHTSENGDRYYNHKLFHHVVPLAEEHIHAPEISSSH
ncbi:ion channel [Tumidithrix elongata RA019]|uniref:Ion channel n=1 Tax=Tumidithrix elongata BACA0141 TaxID=2716417 RepID=A0AAW9PVA7_9CYAN|nr:ion channel [Tumidithrix elongata RA019]